MSSAITRAGSRGRARKEFLPAGGGGPDSVEAAADLTPDNALVRVDNTGSTPRNIQASGIDVSDADDITLPTGSLLFLRNSNSYLHSNAAGEALLHASTTVNIEGGATANVSEQDFKLTTVGTGLFIKEGSNATMGTATLVAGTVTVSTTKVTTSSRIFLTGMSAGAGLATWGSLTADEAKITAGTSFVIESGLVTDTRKVRWWIVEPA